mgnify:CR=1 FL=1
MLAPPAKVWHVPRSIFAGSEAAGPGEHKRDAHQPLVEPAALELKAVIAEIAAEGIAAGDLRAADPGDVTLALMGVLSFNIDLTLAHPELGLGQDGLRRTLDLVFAGLAAPALTLQEKTR